MFVVMCKQLARKLASPPFGFSSVVHFLLVVLSCYSIEFRDSLPRFKKLTFRGHVLRHRDIPLAREIAVSPWLGGPDCALPCFEFVGFLFFFVWGRLSHCRISDVGLSDVGLLWKRVSEASGGALDQVGTKAPHKPNNPRARAKEYIYGAS